MNRRIAAAAATLLAGSLAALPAPAQDAAPPGVAAPSPTAPATVPAAAPLRILYLSRAEDPAYRPVEAQNGVFRPARPEPSPGAELAVRDTRATARAAGVAFELVRRVLAEDEPVEASLPDVGSAVAVVADLPGDDLAALARAAPATLPLLNVRDPDDALRRDFCGRALFHVAPSTGMLTDALAQFVVWKNWRRVLVLYGPLPADKALADSFSVSAKKFGARVVDAKAFAYGNDPRRREETDVALMTADGDYDIVFLADTAEDFGRVVPYGLSKPRPVMGTEGLRASAWQADAERFGAPQVNHRFSRLAHRDMEPGDWATWVAVRAVVEAAVRTKARTATTVGEALARDELPIDVSKGVQSSFRPWDHQLRQAIMLHTADAVVGYAPFEGFLHRNSPLDTLGIDEGESLCHPN